MKKITFLFGILLISLSTFAQDITGDWYGVLDVGIAQLPLVLHINQEDSGYAASLDSPNQNAKGIPVPNLQFEDDTLTIDLSNLQAKYIGKFDRETNTFDGDFTQRGQTLPLKFSRKKSEAPKRPQEPKKPYPYYSENVSFQNKKDSVTLAGTLTIPKGKGNFPAVILINGSGPVNRNEEVFGHKLFLVISDYLTQHGIAVLRYDKRGIGKSTGHYSGATTADFAKDAEAAFAYLRKRKEINTAEIGLIGHSEGGTIAPIVAAKNKNVAFIVLLAGTGVNGGKVLLKQQYLIGKAEGETEEKLRKNRSINEQAYKIIRNIQDSIQLRQKLYAYLKKSLKDYPNTQKPAGISNEKFLTLMMKTYMNPWMRYFIGYDPKTALEYVSCPVLALVGSNDLQVDADQNLPAIIKALKKGGNTHVTAKKLEGLNHLFQESNTGSPLDYQKIEQTFSPKALKTIKTWILDTVK